MILRFLPRLLLPARFQTLVGVGRAIGLFLCALILAWGCAKPVAPPPPPPPPPPPVVEKPRFEPLTVEQALERAHLLPQFLVLRRQLLAGDCLREWRTRFSLVSLG